MFLNSGSKIGNTKISSASTVVCHHWQILQHKDDGRLSRFLIPTVLMKLFLVIILVIKLYFALKKIFCFVQHR